MKLLILASRFPYPIEKGDKLRLYYQLKVLSQYNQIELICLNPGPVPEEHLKEIQPYCRIHIIIQPVWKSIFHACMGWFGKWPAQIAWFYNPFLRKKILVKINEIQPDHIYVQLLRMAPYVLDVPINKTLDYMDCFSYGMQSRAKTSSIFLRWFYQKEALKFQKYEDLIYPFFDHHCIISAQDRSRLTLPKSSIIHCIPNGVDATYFSKQEEASINNNKKYDLLFVGNLGYQPNIEACLFIIQQILPKLPKHITFLMAGARPDVTLTKLVNDRIHLLNWPKDIRVAYQRGKIFIAPLFMGSGQQNKILEAMAMQVPCITTSIVNNAIAGTHNIHLMIADHADAFIDAINQLGSNEQLYQSIATQGRKFIEAQYTWEQQVRKLHELFWN